MGAIAGLGIATLIHWLVPGAEDQLTTLYAALVAVGFILGLVLEHYVDQH